MDMGLLGTSDENKTMFYANKLTEDNMSLVLSQQTETEVALLHFQKVLSMKRLFFNISSNHHAENHFP